MKAVVKFAPGYGNLEIRDIPKPTIKQHEVLIEIKAAGICGSDLHHYEFGAQTGVPVVHQIAIPVVLGHEFSGDVVEIGNEVKGWNVGERIVSETHAHACYECHMCRTGNYHLCQDRRGFGAAFNGAFTQYIVVPARLLHRIPDSISYPEATVLQPAADIVHAVIARSKIRPGDKVAVLGPGPMGLLAVEVSKAVGAEQVIVVGLDVDRERMEIAKTIGADFAINAGQEDLIEVVKQLTEGRGVDVVFETSGSEAGVIQGLKILAKLGELTVIGVPTGPVQIALEDLQLAEQTIQTSVMSTWPDYERAIRLVKSGKLQLKPLISHILPITDWKRGFELALAKKACKVVFTPVG